MDRCNANDRYQRALCIAPEHPCLPGHFPGHPLVPGVVLLEYVAQALRDWRNQRLARVREVKFLASLHPGESADLELMDASDLIRFELRREGNILARGVIEGAP
ncbi:hydroxymyristoyl-ACP dehydratase [Dyella monticola]|uniref:Hydroxymyristoyl-ACP dehydratase n=1 Tax=Dyella monticola TaxID=1927958 RepID=A0A370X1K0_9GAMM|nr:hydroxymyristoyl-ACP dehydratase [Dyella monticola]RDS82160.1 hydroxymyristoyl-ACP dehydratase [Dyella monticola]